MANVLMHEYGPAQMWRCLYSARYDIIIAVHLFNGHECWGQRAATTPENSVYGPQCILAPIKIGLCIWYMSISSGIFSKVMDCFVSQATQLSVSLI